MKRCTEFEPLIEKMLAEEIGDAERDRLLAHAESCGACREFVELHHRLMEPEVEVDLPTDEEFAAMRRSVLRRIAPERSAAGLLDRMRVFFAQPLLAGAGVALVALLTLWVGFRLGSAESEPVASVDAILAGMLEEARGNRGFDDVQDSPYSYSNVAFRDTSDGRLSLSFDVSRYVEATLPPDDPLVRDVLVQSLVNPAPLGTRLQALNYARGVAGGAVNDALMWTMLNDPNDAVRLRALDALSVATNDPEVQAAYVAVLRGDRSVRMRMRALDMLAGSGLAEERFDQVLTELERNDDRALLVHAARYPARAGSDR
ncbi:MAG: zf-HC2 domain-containing protein [bacterium]|nr:zf-HC2 domain-containing protein [bacterium]